MAKMKGGDLIVEHLINNDIPYVFGICGHGNVGLLDSLHAARDKITMISPRHEQVAAHMADAYFRVKHEAVATLTSCGPGSCNIVGTLAVIAKIADESDSATAGLHLYAAVEIRGVDRAAMRLEKRFTHGARDRDVQVRAPPAFPAVRDRDDADVALPVRLHQKLPQ